MPVNGLTTLPWDSLRNRHLNDSNRTWISSNWDLVQTLQANRATYREMHSLAAERDPDIYFEGILQLGQRLEGGNQLQEAARVYSALIGDASVISSVRTRAQRHLDAIQGTGDSVERFSFLIRRVAAEATRPDMLIAMSVAGASFRLARLATATRLAVPIRASYGMVSGEFLLRGAANSVGFLAETAAFTGTAKIAGSALGQHQEWSGGALFREWGSGASMLLGLRLMGGLSQSLLQRTIRSGSLASESLAIRLAASLGPQVSMYSGILLGNRLAEWAGFHPASPGNTPWVDGLATLLQFHVASRIQNGVLGPRFSQFERMLDVRADGIFAAFPRRWHPGEINPIPFAYSGSRLIPRPVSPEPPSILLSVMHSPNGRPSPLAQKHSALAEVKSSGASGEFVIFRDPILDQLPVALQHLQQFADRQVAMKALGLIYLGSQGPIRPVLFETLQGMELGKDYSELAEDLLSHPQLSHSHFASPEMGLEIFYGLERLQRGDDFDLLDFVFGGESNGERVPAPSPFGMAGVTTEEQFGSQSQSLKQIAPTAKRPPAHWPLSAVLANAENHALAQTFEAEGRRIRRDSELDPVTGVMSRIALARLTRRLEKRTVASSRSVDLNRKSDWILLVDLDHFKNVNERYTHPGADVVLHDVAQIMARAVRRYSGDLVFRFGGDEFVVFLSNSGQRGAEKVAEKIRAAVEANRSMLWNGNAARVTISVAGAEMRPLAAANEELTSEGALDAAVARASRQLLKGKQAGERNSIFIVP